MTTTTRNRPPGPGEAGRRAQADKMARATIALAGNPNVGKSTIFNRLTGLKQHTGNWPGKTVGTAEGAALLQGERLRIVDTPGAYSLMASSAEEEVARDYICFHNPDCVVVVTDATCLERNLNLAIQIREITPHMVLCVNLLDEAKRKGLRVDLEILSSRLGVPVVGASARRGAGLQKLLQEANAAVRSAAQRPLSLSYPAPLEAAVESVAARLRPPAGCRLSRRWLALKLLEGDPSLLRSIEQYLGVGLQDDGLRHAVEKARADLEAVYPGRPVSELMVDAIVGLAGEVYREAVTTKEAYNRFDRRLDKILTSKRFGIPIMLALLLLVFWITVTGANYPSQLLSQGFGHVEDWFRQGLTYIGAPAFLTGLLVDGVARTLFWVVSVMLPPMAIFFPLFTLLEDLGYLPRVAFNLDHCFARSKSCGKQALTMCMGLGCNAVGVTGCRIIDSPRERMLAVLTNTFVPCNGRFPSMIAVSSLFFASVTGWCRSILSAAALLVIISLGVGVTLLVSRLLSATILKG
ncbi:MAG: ferrous iron transporter B, partial [Clostridiales bacterium]|nr:ferrous iron transporter B [Clostridiales bacterium]